jgi:hypothetical protein
MQDQAKHIFEPAIDLHGCDVPLPLVSHPRMLPPHLGASPSLGRCKAGAPYAEEALQGDLVIVWTPEAHHW